MTGAGLAGFGMSPAGAAESGAWNSEGDARGGGPLRLTFVFSTRSMGGMEARAARLAQLARQRGHSVLFGCPAGSRLDERLAQYGVPRFHLYIHGALDLVSAMKLAGRLKRCRAELVMAFSGKDYWMTILAGRLAGAAAVLNRSTPSALRAVSVPVVSRADAILAVSQGVKDILVKQGVPAGLIQVIYVGVDTVMFSPDAPPSREQLRAAIGLPRDSFAVGCLGRSGKGQEDLLAADRWLCDVSPDTYYFFAGAGISSYLAPVMADQPDLKRRVILRDLLPHAQMPSILKALDVIVMTPERESFSNAVLEAMAMEKPLILSRAAGNMEAVVDHESGILIEAHDIDAIGENLRALYLAPDRRRALGKHARDRVCQWFSEPAMMADMERSWALAAGCSKPTCR